MHLKKDLDAPARDWKGCSEPAIDDEISPTKKHQGPLTPYGIARDVQARLANIRTDLDSFSEIESYALMTNGYEMIGHELAKKGSDFGEPPGDQVPWDFLKLKEAMGLEPSSEKAHADLLRQLDVAQHRLFKVKGLTPLAWILDHAPAFFIVLFSLILVLIWWASIALFFWNQTLTWLVPAGLLLLCPLFIRLYHWVFNGLYIRRGKVDRLRNLK